MKKIIITLSLVLACMIASAQPFQLIGGGTAYGMSPDGKYVVGQIGASNNNSYTFVWSLDDGFTTRDEDRHNSDGNGTQVRAINSNGRIVGITPFTDFIVYDAEIPSEGNPWPFITAGYSDIGVAAWTMLPLNTPTSSGQYGFSNYVYGVSEIGNILVGGRRPGTVAQRFRATVWDVSNPSNIVSTYLYPDVLGSNGSMAMAASFDGTIVAGWKSNAAWTQVEYLALWAKNSGSGVYETLTIEGNPGGQFQNINESGTLAVGFHSATVKKAAIYNINTGILSDLETLDNESYANAVSNNGIVVGYWGNSTASNGTAFIYTEEMGMRSLTDFFEEYSIDYPEGFVFRSATGISSDGSKISGWGLLNGSTVSFYAEIPQVTSVGNFPVGRVSIESPAYQQVLLSWVSPVGNNPALTGYNIYDGNNLLLQSVTDTFYLFTGLADGSYSYKVTAVYGADETAASSLKTIVIGKVAFPFYEAFDYPSHTDQPSSAALYAAYWDVSADGIPRNESWYVSVSGIPPNSVGFLSPQTGAFSESVTSPYIDASGTSNLYLSFNVVIPSGESTLPNQQKLAVDLFVNNAWINLADYEATGPWNSFVFKSFNISQYAGNDNIRVRFRCHGIGTGEDLNWFVDNVNLTSDNFVVSAPLSIEAHRVGDNVHVNWTDPNGCVTLRYMQDESAYWSLGNEGVSFIAANMFPAEDLELFENYQLTSLSFLKITTTTISEVPTFKWYVMQDGVRLFDANVVDPITGWNTINLENPITIDNTKALYYGVEVLTHNVLDNPIGCGSYYIIEGDAYVDLTTHDGRGNIFSEDGGQTWQKISDFASDLYPDFEYELFCIKATLAPANAEPKEQIIGYRLFRGAESMGIYFGSSTSMFRMNNCTDFNPLPENQEACYSVYVVYSTLDYSNDITDCVPATSVEQIIAKNQLLIYPNPATDELRIMNYELRTGDNVQILDVSGKIITNYELRITESTTTINVSALSSGIYFVKIGKNFGRFVKK